MIPTDIVLLDAFGSGVNAPTEKNAVLLAGASRATVIPTTHVTWPPRVTVPPPAAVGKMVTVSVEIPPNGSTNSM